LCQESYRLEGFIVFDKDQCRVIKSALILHIRKLWTSLEGGKMEHRWSIRKPIQDCVTLAFPPWKELQANISDISLGGLAITGLHQLIPINTVVTLSFALERDGRASYYRLRAQVAYCESERIGFLFMEPEDVTLHELREMLYSPTSKLLAAVEGQPYVS
jgi:hypothetical protein